MSLGSQTCGERASTVFLSSVWRLSLKDRRSVSGPISAFGSGYSECPQLSVCRQRPYVSFRPLSGLQHFTDRRQRYSSNELTQSFRKMRSLVPLAQRRIRFGPS